jgi:hypothetical protein
LVSFSVNARGYSLLTLFFLMLVGFGLYLRERNNLTAWLAFAVTAALGLYTVPVMVYPLAVVTTWLGLTVACGDGPASRRAVLRRLGVTLLIIVGLTALLYAPIFLVSGPAALLANETVVSVAWPQFFALLPVRLAESIANWRLNMPRGLEFLLALGFVVALLAHRRIASHRVPLVSAVLVLPLLVLLQRVVPTPRVLVFLFPLFVLTAAAGLHFLCAQVGGRTRTWLGSALVLTLTLTMSGGWGYRAMTAPFLFDVEGERETLPRGEEVVGFLRRELKPGDRLLYYWPSHNSIRHYSRSHTLEPFLRRDGSPKRLIVVVNGMWPALTVPAILKDRRYAAEQYGSPAPLLDLGSAQVYEVLPR